MTPAKTLNVSVASFGTNNGPNGSASVGVQYLLSVAYGDTAQWEVRRTFADFARLHKLTEQAFDDDAMLPYFPDDSVAPTHFSVSPRAAAARNAICLQALRSYTAEYLANWASWDRRRDGATPEDALGGVAPLPHPDSANPSPLPLLVLLVEFLGIDAHVDCGAAYRALSKRRIGPALFSHGTRALPPMSPPGHRIQHDVPASHVRARKRVSFSSDVKLP